MALPEQVKIGPMQYDLVLDPSLLGKQLYGSIRFLDGQIAIVPDLPPVLAKVKVMHESIHAMLAQAGFDEHDERLVDSLAYGFIQFIQDNPQFLE